MDMGSSTAAMAGMATSTGAASATTTSSMSMSMGDGDSCKISMLWNWYTVDACFISSTWHITSTGMFAGSCIGVILLVMSIEFLRRLGKEYDRYIVRQFQRQVHLDFSALPSSVGSQSVDGKIAGVIAHDTSSGRSSDLDGAGEPRTMTSRTFRPNVLQQAVRASLHMVQFAVAYFVMLLAMYYNGYFIICIIIGAWLGAFVFSWEKITLDGPKEEVTVCCG